MDGLRKLRPGWYSESVVFVALDESLVVLAAALKMFWKLVLCLLVLRGTAEGESNSTDSLQVQQRNSKENVTEMVSSELLNGKNDSIYSLSSGEGYSDDPLKNDDKPLNRLLIFSDLENVQNGDTITEEKNLSKTEESENNRNISSEDPLNDVFLDNYSQVPEILSHFHDMETHFDSDYWLQMNVSDGYDPKRTKKNKILNKKDAPLKLSDLKSSRNSLNPIQGTLKDKINELPSTTSKNSIRRIDDVKRNGLFYLGEHRNNNSELPSNAQFLDHDISTISELTEPSKTGDDYIFKYHLNQGSGQRNDFEEGIDKDKLHQLAYLNSQKSPNHQRMKEFGEVITKAEDDDPSILNEAEDTRKVTILKQKTVHSVSKEEEQETVNIRQNPIKRLSDDDIVAIETQSDSTDLQQPVKQDKIEKREETIVLVEGTHIPGKNYGPEDDLFGYYTDSYDNQESNSKHNQMVGTALNNGPSVQSPHKIRQDNHGDGFSTRYFVNHPKLSEDSHDNNFKENERFVFPPSKSPPRVTHEIRAVSLVEGEKSLSLPEKHGKSRTNAKYQENRNNAKTTEPIQSAGHEGEDQYVVVDVDPNQIYMDEKTGQLIKFVTEEEAEKLGVTAEHQVEKGRNENSAQERPERNPHYGHLEEFSTSLGSKEKGINSQIFGNGGDTKRYVELTNVDLSSHSPINKRRKGQKSQFVGLNKKSVQLQVPVSDISGQSNLHTVSYEGSNGVQENHENYDLSSHSKRINSKNPQFIPVKGKNTHVPVMDIIPKPKFRTVSYEDSHGVGGDQGNYDVSSYSEGISSKKPQFVAVNEKSVQFHVPMKDTIANSKFRSVSHEGSHNLKSRSGSTSGTEYIVLCPEKFDHSEHNQDFGKKLNFDSLGNTATNKQNIENDYQNNFKGSGDATIQYDNDDGYKISSDGLNNSGNEVTYTEDNFETHGGNQAIVENFKGSEEGLQEKPGYGQLNDFQIGGKSIKSENIGNFKGSAGGLDGESDPGILYELQADGKSKKDDYTEMPLYKENMHLYKKDTESSVSSFPSKGKAVSTVYFSMVHHKAKNSRKPRLNKQNQNHFEFAKPQNNFKGISQKQNGGLRMNSIHDHENFRVSLQNLYGHNGGSFSSGKNKDSNFESLGYSKGNNNYILPTGVNFKGQQLYEEVNLSPPQSSIKGSSGSYNENNLKSGFNFQNSRKPSGGYSSGISGSGSGKNGGYKSNGISYSSPNANLQPNSYQMVQNQFAGLNNVHQSDGPVEYIIVEEDDNNHEIKGISEDPFLLEYENYNKRNNVGLPSTGGLEHQPHVIKSSTTYSMEPNVRFVVDGGRDTAPRLRRLAATGFHMARGVLPYFPISGPRSIKGNLNFGLEINKRKGPAIISPYL
ncbi:hypothetical protein HNY73_000598 [Argiope bruennichi]|uniref:Uncharacterized protein n=1 Tax=Argiope bruennichi TaxID=94029 RepID=A0A8T0FZT5_ARGBR|nr:hypothetical protein HNY73_000598 [Argiope bruennichi]